MAGKLRYIAALALIVTGLTAFSQNTQKKKETIDYIDKYKDIAMTEMVKYKVPASITLAQGILESGNGQSKLAKKGNNHFGIKCHSDWKGKTMRQDDDAPNECFRVYDDPEDSYRDHSEFLRKGTRYAFLFDLSITDYKAWAKGLKKAGYATLPTYANVLINLIETYDLQQYDELVVKGKFKPHKKKETTTQEVKKDEKPAKPAKRRRKNAVVLPAPVLENCSVVSMTPNHNYIRENFGVKFIITKEGDNLDVLSKDLKISTKPALLSIRRLPLTEKYLPPTFGSNSTPAKDSAVMTSTELSPSGTAGATTFAPASNTTGPAKVRPAADSVVPPLTVVAPA